MSTSPVRVELLASSEWRTLREMRLRAVADSPHAFLVHAGLERPDVEEDWHAYLRSGLWLVARDGANRLGMLCLVTDPENGRRYVEAMWVDPAHRTAGVGKQLLLSAADIVRASHHLKMFLWVLDGNDRARGYYRRRGFLPTGRRQPVGSPPKHLEEEYSRCLGKRTNAGKNGDSFTQ